jgi:hypothetical protein
MEKYSDFDSKLIKKENTNYELFYIQKLIIEELFEMILHTINDKNVHIDKILEPSCGSSHIIQYIDHYFPNINIDAIEYDFNVFRELNKNNNLKNKNNVNIINGDFINFDFDVLYDLIIITNLYNIACKKEHTLKAPRGYVLDKMNIFGLYIIHALTMLKNGGILVYLIPKSFLNSFCYIKINKYIKEICEIVEIIDFDSENKLKDKQGIYAIILYKL